LTVNAGFTCHEHAAAINIERDRSDASARSRVRSSGMGPNDFHESIAQPGPPVLLVFFRPASANAMFPFERRRRAGWLMAAKAGHKVGTTGLPLFLSVNGLRRRRLGRIAIFRRIRLIFEQHR
jgi:hypothetical protein